jgi:enoyl-CoA hydratase
MNTFDFSIDNHIAHLRLNRPEAMNTINPLMWKELEATLTELHRGTQARVLVISSTGKHFTAGMSLDAFSGPIALDDKSSSSRAAIYDSLMDMQKPINQLEALRYSHLYRRRIFLYSRN